mgnify:CR=1 FL=1
MEEPERTSDKTTLSLEGLYKYGERSCLNYMDDDLEFTMFPMFIKSDISMLDIADIQSLSESDKKHIAKSMCDDILRKLYSDFKCKDIKFEINKYTKL